MARMSAELVVSLLDRVSGPAAKARTSLTALQRAERDVYLARNNTRLSRTQIAEERLLAAQEAERQKRIAQWTAFGRAAGVATVAAGYVAVRTWRNYAQLERTIGRIVINADKPAAAIKPTIALLQQAADAAKMPLDDMVTGLETLIASGRTLEESLGFLSTVARTSQASGAAISDIALTADSVAGSLDITADRMQSAFDILAAAGKAGKFELDDMARELPALLPAFAALGYKGEEGLKKIAAMLQIVRNQTGTSAEAATNLGNVFQKVYSRETANNFKKFGIDITRVLDKTRKEGGDVIDELVRQTSKALKGDLSKLPLLFTDAQVQKGMRALLTQLPELEAQVTALGQASGTVARDFAQITGDAEGSWQQLVNNIQKTGNALGELTGKVLNPTLGGINDQLSETMAILEGGKKLAESGRDEDATKDQWRQQYRAMHPDAWFPEVNRAFTAALAQLGRGEIRNIFDPLRETERRRALARSYGEAGYVPGRGGGGTPLPSARPKRWEEMSPAERRRQAIIEGAHEPAGGKPNFTLPEAGPPGLGGGFFDPDEFKRSLQSGGVDAGSKIAEGGTQAGQNAASTFTSGVAGAGQSFGQSAAASFVAGVSSFLSSAKADLMRPVGSLKTTGQQVRIESNGQAVDFGGQR